MLLYPEDETNLSLALYVYCVVDVGAITLYEYVVVEDVYNGIEIGRKMIENLGYNLHYKPVRPKDLQRKFYF